MLRQPNAPEHVTITDDVTFKTLCWHATFALKTQ